MMQHFFRHPINLLFVLLAILIIGITCVRSYHVHPAVLTNDADEAHLPYYFRRSHLVTPHASVALAKSSWFGPGEKEVHHRETEQIDRSEIFTVLRHAGLIHIKNY